jgi:uncharacterized protein (DUF1684 family)
MRLQTSHAEVVPRGWIRAVILAAVALASCSSQPADPAAAYAATLGAERAAKDAAFRRQTDQPIPADKRGEFLPLSYYPPDMSFIVPASFTPAAVRTPVKIPTSTGALRNMEVIGTLEFTLKGHPASLEALVEAGSPPDPLFVPFADATSGTETYAGGRYLEIPRTATGAYTVDFNRAFQPYCSYNHTYECPYPPASNRLPLPVRAGERLRPAIVPPAAR